MPIVASSRASRSQARPSRPTSQVIGSAIVGALLGAGLGAALGVGRGAAIGAATGTLIGTGTGSSGSAWAQVSVQQRYIAYMQCMYAKGNQVPGYIVVATTPPPR